MSNTYFNIAYSPARDGYSTSTWRTMYGDVAIASGQLQFNKAAILHYGDIVRGDAVFSINIGAPVAGDNSKFGFTQYSKGAYIYFKIVNGVLTAEVSNGTNSKSSAVIPWVSEWTDTDTEFRIKWEAGMVSFFIAGQLKAVIDDTSSSDALATLAVPGCPMSLYVASDSPDLLLLDYIVVKSIQSFVVSTGNANSIFEIIVTESDKISISSVVTDLVITPLHTNSGIITETPKIRESVTVFTDIYNDMGTVNDTPKIRESVTVETPA